MHTDKNIPLLSILALAFSNRIDKNIAYQST